MSYRRRASALHAAHAGAGCAYCLALALAALMLSNPVVLGTLALVVLAAGQVAGVGREVRRAALFSLPLALGIAVINALVSRNGLTVIVRLGQLPILGHADVTLEATVYGLILGLRATTVIVCGALYTAAIDPDQVLALFRRVSFRSALTATLATRMVPVLIRDSHRFADAQRCRPGRPPSRVTLLRAASSGVLDRALDVAAALEVRGFGSARRPAARRRPLSRHDIQFGAAAAAVIVIALATRIRRAGAVHGLPGPAFVGRPRSARRQPRDRGLRAGAVCRSTGDRAVSLLEFDGVTYSYPGAAKPALCDVSLEIGHGQLVVVAGASGSGKSTLLRAANGLVPHFHGGTFAGDVTVAGSSTRDHGPGELAHAVGSLFQDPETQVVMTTVRAELAFALENRGESQAAIARAVEEVALALGIAHLLERATDELSGGELQRVALGAALVGRPQLVVLDEPTSQLDPVAGDELIGLLRRCNEDFDTTIVLSEHRLERCLSAADRVIALDDGRVAADATPDEFLVWAGESAPSLATPGARLLDQLGLAPVPGVKRARASLRDQGLLGPSGVQARDPIGEPPPRRWRRRAAPAGHAPALELDGVWHELRAGRVILRDVSLRLRRGERVALMGRNGAGKSTLLRHAAGLQLPTRGTVRSAGRVALLLQNPNDYLVHERVEQEATDAALARVGLDPFAFAGRHPRELSGGERQRLALAIVLGEGSDAAAVCLDEPTRGMDRERKHELAGLLSRLDDAVLVATHDPEFVAAFAQRVILLGDGAVIADGTTHEVLAGGSYFATETARILSGWGAALTPDEGAEVIRGRASEVIA